jgi:hypothetical protein
MRRALNGGVGGLRRPDQAGGDRENPIRSTPPPRDIGSGSLFLQTYPPRGAPLVDNPVWAICERVAEVQASLDDHIAGGKHSAADVIAKVQAVLSEAELLRASFVGYFPPNTPPVK